MAPLIAGVTADWFTLKELSFTIRWGTIGAEADAFMLPAVNLRSLEFIFVIAFVLGMYSIHRLLAVREEGEVEESIVIHELYAEVRKLAQHISNVPGIRQLTNFPYAVLRKAQHDPSAVEGSMQATSGDRADSRE